MQQDYRSIERRSFVEEEDENTFIPGPVDVKTFPNRWRKAPFLIVLLLIFGLVGYVLFSPRPQSSDKEFETRVWDSYDRSALDGVKPISTKEYLARQSELVRLLKQEKVDAFITEPGATTQYYANFSQQEWELTERPFLLVVTRDEVFYLAPLFEVSRAMLLSIPSKTEPRFITWAEGRLDKIGTKDISPYKTLLNNLPENPKIVVDDAIRFFISQSLLSEGATILPQPSAIAAIRETKSPAEIDILRAVNIATVEAIRAIQKHIRVGMSEKLIWETLDRILLRAGMVPYFNLALFGSDAANPHGSVDENRELVECEFILIDVGGILHGYSSDITRTFLPPGMDIEKCVSSGNNVSLGEMWDVVHSAQSAGIEAILTNHTCAEVDLAARKVIEDAGLGQYFGHRLGHGLGIEGHERPYLNKGNTNTKLRVGNVFTIEPGIYIEGYAGVRLEDVVLVTEDGPELLSGARAKDWLHP